MAIKLKSCFLFFCLLFCSFSNDIYSQCSSSFNTTPANHEICDNQSVQFTLTSNSVITQRIWNFGDGSPTSGSSNPSHVFTSTKDTVFKISLIVKCSNGQRDTSTVNLKLFSRPQADFTASKSSLCSISDSSCFTNLSTNLVGVTYLWDFGDLAISTDYSTCHTYYTSGNFDVELRAIRPSNQGSCQQRVIKTVSVKESPNPDFDIDPSSGCLPFGTNITNNTQSRENIVDWDWDFGDGTHFAGADPGFKAYTVAGIYNLKLSTSNTTGCKNFTSLPIFVSNAPTLSLGTPPNVCPNIPITITAFTNAVNAFYTWNVSGGQIISGVNTSSIVVKWSTGGTKNIFIDVDQNGCVVSQSTVGYVYPVIDLRAFYPNGNNVCTGGSIDVEILPTLLPSYVFYKGNNNILTTSVSGIKLTNLQADTSLNVKVKDANSCTFTANISGTVKPYPILTVTSSPSSTICPGTNATISVASTPAPLTDYLFLLNYVPVQSGTGPNFSRSNFQDKDRIQVIGTLNGCADSSSIIKIILIDSLALQPPVLNCGRSTTNSVEFVWNSIAGASLYKVSVDNGPFTTPSSGATGLRHSVTGLNMGQNVTISVMIVRNLPCADTVISEVLTCTAINCAGLSFSLKYDSLYCVEDNIVVKATSIKGITPSYSFSWNNFITKDSIYIIKGKDLLTAPGAVLEVILSDPSFDPCPSFTQKTYGLEVTSVPALALSLSRKTNKCAAKDTIIITSSPSNLDSYEYYMDNVRLTGKFKPIEKIPLTDTLPHIIKARAVYNNCFGPYSTILIKGINIVNYAAIIQLGAGNKIGITGEDGPSIIVCDKPDPDGPKISVALKTQTFLEKIVGTDTTFFKPDSAIFYKQGEGNFYKGPENERIFTGPSETSIFSSQVYYNGCLYSSINQLTVGVASSPVIDIKPTGDTLNHTLNSRGLIEETCTYNTFYYKIFPRLSYVTWGGSVNNSTSTHISADLADSSYAFYAQVDAYGTQENEYFDAERELYSYVKSDYTTLQTQAFVTVFSNFKNQYATIPGISYSALNQKAKKSADSLIYYSLKDNYSYYANRYAQDSITLVFTNTKNNCQDSTTIYAKRGINFHGIIDGEQESCYSNMDFNLDFATLSLTQPNDTITFTINTIINKDSTTSIQGSYVQRINKIASAPFPDDKQLIQLSNYGDSANLIRILPQLSFKGYYPASHTIKLTNKKGCYLEYQPLTTSALKPSQVAQKIDLRICVNDVMDGTKIRDTITKPGEEKYNYWRHPFVTPDIANNKYIFKPDLMISSYRTYMKSCDVPDTTGSCCVDLEMDGCVMNCEDFQYIPNAISPNGDNINDKWKIFGLRNPKVEIFNRWGELIYHSDNYMNDWDGKAHNGVPFPDGVYFYVVYPFGEFTMNTQTTHHLAGISPDDYIKQNEHSAFSSDLDPTATITRQLPNHDQIPDQRYLDPKTKASYYFCKKISFNELRGTLIIQR